MGADSASVPSALATALADRYRIDRELGAGGMATVYLARDLKHDRQVALKVLDPELGAVLGAERFLAEIRVTAKLQHPNLLPLFDSGEANGLLFYVMPFVEGESLRVRLDREKQLPIDEAIHFASAIANALDYAHGHGVIHRDLKPENILLQAGEPLVADFGIALAVSNAGGARITQTGLSLGTPQYMSPEQATGDRTVDGRTDIYSLGAVTYEMLTGEAPHTGNTAQAIVAKLMTEDVRSLTLLRRNVAPHVDAAVLHALEKLPADRFATAHEFANALQGHDSVISAAGRPRVPATTARRNRWSYAPWAIAMVFGAAALWSARWGGTGGSPGVVVSSLLPPADLEFSEQSSFGALSPDGRQFAFVTLGLRGESRLWVRRLDTLAARPLTGTEGARAPFWSPDGKRLAYVAGNVLFTVDVSGSAPHRVCEAPNASSGSWGAGDVIVVATSKGFLKTSPAGPTCSVAITHKAGTPWEPRHPTLLPDGRHILFTRLGKSDFEIAVGDLRTGESHTLLEQASDPTFIAPDILLFGETATEGTARLRAQRFHPDQLRLTGPRVAVSEAVRTGAGVFAYAASAGSLIYLPGLGDRGEIRTDRAGRVLDTIASGRAWMHAWARDHAWIAHSSDEGLRQFDVSKHVEVQLVRLPFGASSPAWAPRDSLLAYSACDSVRCRLVVRNLTTDRDSTLLGYSNPDGFYWPTSWSSDGRFLVSSRIRAQYEAQASQIWVYDMRAGTHVPLVTQQGTLEGSISPDGRWLAYRSDESGASEVMVRPFMREGAPQRVSPGGGRLPYWRADGRELVYQAPDGHVMSVDVEPGTSFAFRPPRPLFAAPAWTRHIFFDIGTSFGMRPDAQQFTFRMTATSSTAVLVQNWQSLLK